MILWSLILLTFAILNIPIMFAQYWLVFGIWPVSWTWFIFFMVLLYGQQQFAQYAAKKLMEAYTK